MFLVLVTEMKRQTTEYDGRLHGKKKKEIQPEKRLFSSLARIPEFSGARVKHKIQHYSCRASSRGLRETEMDRYIHNNCSIYRERKYILKHTSKQC